MFHDLTEVLFLGADAGVSWRSTSVVHGAHDVALLFSAPLLTVVIDGESVTVGVPPEAYDAIIKMFVTSMDDYQQRVDEIHAEYRASLAADPDVLDNERDPDPE